MLSSAATTHHSPVSQQLAGEPAQRLFADLDRPAAVRAADRFLVGEGVVQPILERLTVAKHRPRALLGDVFEGSEGRRMAGHFKIRAATRTVQFKRHGSLLSSSSILEPGRFERNNNTAA